MELSPRQINCGAPNPKCLPTESADSWRISADTSTPCLTKLGNPAREVGRPVLAALNEIVPALGRPDLLIVALQDPREKERVKTGVVLDVDAVPDRLAVVDRAGLASADADAREVPSLM